MQFKDPLLKRLALDEHLLKELCESSDLIEAIPLNGGPDLPPDKYEITYKVKSIIAIDDDKQPVYGELHKAEITLPSGYPMIKSPTCKMTTDVWHPNIRSSGNLKGHICINAQVLGTWHTLDLLVEQIGEMLQYKNYHAQKIQPYPEDPIVAQWVMEIAEPQGIVNKKENIVVDNRPLRKPSATWMESRKQTRINILNIRAKSAIKLKEQHNTNPIKVNKK